MSHSILLINGPNLNLLGTREPSIYGAETLADVEKMSKSQAKELGVNLECFQSNHEGEIIEAIHNAKNSHHAIIINPGAFTHTSIAIRDALIGVELPIYEVHISNVHAREDFRHNSYVSGIAVGVICGFGTKGYKYAIETAVNNLNKN